MNYTKYLTLIIFITTVQTCYGQIVNSLSANKTGMYYYSVDTLLQILESKQNIDRIILEADKTLIQDFPESIRDIQIIKHNKYEKYRKSAFKNMDVKFVIKGLSIIRDQITLSIYTITMTNNNIHIFADGAYIFYFKYLPESQTYELTKIKSGIEL